MRVTHDREARAIYAYLSDKRQDRSVSVSEDCILDYAEDGTLVGVELLDVDLDDITGRAAQATPEV